MSYSDDGLPAARAVRADGWTVERQLAFLEALAGHGRIAEAARAVDMSAASAYRLRAREPAFAFGWRAATTLAYERLREVALDRATNGVLTPRFYHGAVVSETVRYSDRLLLGLLGHLKPEGTRNFATGHRVPAPEPAELWAQAVNAYDTARATGKPLVAPHVESEGRPPPPITREAFLAAIRAQPRFRPPPDVYDDDEPADPSCDEAEVNEITSRA